MKLTTILSVSAFTLFSLVSAQTPPQCVLQCSMQAAAAAGCSGFADVNCVCTSADFQNAAGACLVANCTQSDQEAASALQIALCNGKSVTSGTVTATVAQGSSSISINPSALASVTGSSMGSMSGTASPTGTGGVSATGAVGSASTSIASAASSRKSSASAAASSGSTGKNVELDVKGLMTTALGVMGLITGGMLVL